MITFTKSHDGVVMYTDDTYRETMMLVVERPATEEDIACNPDEYAGFVAATAPPRKRTTKPVVTVSPDRAA